MVSSAKELNNEDFFFSHLAESLDGELSGPAVARFEAILKTPGKETVPEQFQTFRGRLQLGLQSFYLSETEIQALRSLVQDPAVTATQENLRIEELSRGEVINTWFRRFALAAIPIVIAVALVWNFWPRSESSFKPLEYLGYEALAMEEDSQNRLDLPTTDSKEIRQYLAAYPGLEFKPRVLKTLPDRWQPEGVSVIDYEVAKVAVVQYVNEETKEKLFHFSFSGSFSDLPKADVSTMNGIKFQTYGSDQQNMVAWQHATGVMSLLVGRRSAAELYEIAAKGTKD